MKKFESLYPMRVTLLIALTVGLAVAVHKVFFVVAFVIAFIALIQRAFHAMVECIHRARPAPHFP